MPRAFFTSFLLLFVTGTVRGVDFGDEVFPILREHCHECHGPDKQRGSFRLDLRDAALRGGGEGIAIQPGDPGASPLIAHVSAPEGSEKRMPPKGPGLAPEEIETLRAWIAAGATWPDAFAGSDPRLDHWAWRAVTRPDVPLDPSASRHPIDAFVQRERARHGLGPSPRAGRRTLIRRLAFDLHGLPPSPEEIQTFLGDASPDVEAWSRLVDRFLASPRYGERFARHWLDIAHYADTHGFERDKRRDHAWRYRDYVIDAFNRDKPYDRFLLEQIAGDVLWPGREEAVIATGFLAAGPWDFVGQVETKSPVLRRAARSLDLDDMVTQVMTATVGVTVNCARCHDHKLDPVSQEEYFRLRAVFAGVAREDRVTSDGALARYEEERRFLEAERDRIEFAIAEIEGEGIDLADVVGGGNGLGTGTALQGLNVRNAKVDSREFGRLGNVVPNRFASSEFPFIDGLVVPDGGQDGELSVPVSSTGLAVSGLPDTTAQAWDLVRNGPVAAQHSPELDGVDFTAPGRSLLGLHANAGITFDLDAIREATGNDELRFTSRLGYFGEDAPGLRADVFVVIDGEIALSFAGFRRGTGLQSIDLEIPGASRFLTLLSLDAGSISHDQIGFGDPRLKPLRPESMSPERERRLLSLRAQKRQIDFRIAGLGTPPKVYAVTATGELPDVRIERRGNPEDLVGDPLPPGALSLASSLSPDLGDVESPEGERRAALARWIVDPGNPLTRRVLANRVWHWHFGRGLVATPSDFGLGGSEPSHPELLDFLATELSRQGGSLKELHRLILTSETYCQESRFTTSHPAVTIDADNRLLWRQNPRRLEAEATRDAILATSGSLNLEAGGPGFEDFTYKEAYAPIYTYITADEPSLWKRSIYRYVVRTTPDRFMTTLDCPDPANLAPTRLVTTTPLQSLALYNNTFVLRQAGYFAERLRREVGTAPSSQADRAFLLAFGRRPAPEERDLAATFIAREGLFAFCRSLLNANEFVYID